MWVKNRGYTDNQIPHVADISEYATKWISWWKVCQPPWRQDEGWPLLREVPDRTKWGKLTACSQNGMFLVVMSTTWWALALKSPSDRHTFDEAVDNIRWVIEQVLGEPPTPTNAVQDPAPAPLQVANPPKVAWMARGEGIRKPKPSRALLESMN